MNTDTSVQFSLKNWVQSSMICGGLLVTTLVNPEISYGLEPLHKNIKSYTIEIPTRTSLKGVDETDIYFPITENQNDSFPVVLMLQGALVDKKEYSQFATLVASYGFTVVIPNHLRRVESPSGTRTGLLVDAELIPDVLAFVRQENNNPKSPIYGKIDTQKLGLLGHSHGGLVGMTAIQGICFFPACTTSFQRPDELKAGIFYGTHLMNPKTGVVPPINNQGIPLGLIGGTKESIATLDEVQGTYRKIKDSPKILVEVDGANHYGITNENNPERDSSVPTLAQSTAIETIGRWSGLFLRAHILGDSDAFNYIYHTGDDQDPNVTQN